MIYDLIPSSGEAVPQDEVRDLRVGAAIETRHDTGVRSARVFVNGEERPAALMGARSYRQSVSADVTGLRRGEHTARAVATDSEGRTESREWTFSVTVPGAGEVTGYSRIVEGSGEEPRFTAYGSWGVSGWHPGSLGESYRYATPDTTASDPATYRFDVPESGSYEVSGYNPGVPVGVKTISGWEWVRVDQSRTGGEWVSLGTLDLAAGDENYVMVSRWTSGEGYIIADSFKIAGE